jgi:dUTPase
MIDGYSGIPNYKFAVTEGLDDLFLPTRGDSRSTGWDVRAAEGVILRPTETVKIPLGLRCFAPEGFWLELRPRSSTFAKKQISCLYGVIDESYEGQLIFACQWIPDYVELVLNNSMTEYYNQELRIELGERIGQLVPVRRQEMEVVGITNEEFNALCKQRGLARGAGGFGSTGNG